MPQAIPIIRTVNDLRAQVANWKAQGHSVGLVPTMGALHDGHLSLVETLTKHAGKIIVSIFVNPTQFAAHEDLDTYPRTEIEDCAKLTRVGADMAYIPAASEIYPEGFASTLHIGGPSQGLESDSRPHFFDGVAIVVHKLFQQSQADVAIFGEKDYQQLLVIKKMVRDLDIPITIVAGAIMREADGLAMSSRNAYLTPENRIIAGRLNGILKQMATSDLPPLQAEAEAVVALEAAGFTAIDYATIRDAETLALPDATTQARRALIVARIGDIRLLDNMAAK